MNQSNKDLTKLSRLIRAGAIVHAADGSVYRCTSKFAAEGTLHYRLANLQGKPVNTPADFCPVSPALARFAAWMRYKVAFNSDFDLYVKAYIDAAGLPVDPTMNWAKWFQSTIAPKLRSRDEEVVDEAIHQIIIKTLAERSVLSPDNPHGFQQSIEKFPEKTKSLPLARQVTLFLFQVFMWRVGEANEYIQRFIFQKDTDSMWTTEDGEDDGRAVNILDTEDRASEGAYDDVEADVDVEHFLEGFSMWLGKQFRENTVSQYIILFKLLYEEVKASEGIPKPADVFENWHNLTGKSTSYFKVLFSNLPKLISLYIKKHLKGNYEVHPFIEILKHIGGSRNKKVPEPSGQLQPAMASAKKADSGFYGMDVAPMDEGGTLVKDMLDPASAGDSSGSSDSGSKSFSMPGAVAESVIGDVGDLAMLASKSAKQWVLPKCKGCGKSDGAKECPACSGIFCQECRVNHHANNPSHDRIASAKTAGHVIDDAIAELKAEGKLDTILPYEDMLPAQQQLVADRVRAIKHKIGAAATPEQVQNAIRRGDYTAADKPKYGKCSSCGERGQVFASRTNTPPILPFEACSHCMNSLTSWGN